MGLILRHELKFPPEVFEQVSVPVKGFIRLLLDPDPKLRMRCNEALQHPWFESWAWADTGRECATASCASADYAAPLSGGQTSAASTRVPSTEVGDNL